MPRGKKTYPKLGDFLGLHWEKQEPEDAVTMDYCHFCGHAIKTTEEYFTGTAPAFSMSGDVLFYACERCIQAAGIKW